MRIVIPENPAILRAFRSQMRKHYPNANNCADQTIHRCIKSITKCLEEKGEVEFQEIFESFSGDDVSLLTLVWNQMQHFLESGCLACVKPNISAYPLEPATSAGSKVLLIL